MSDRLFDFYEEKAKREQEQDKLELAANEVPERSEGIQLVYDALEEIGEVDDARGRLARDVLQYLRGHKL